MESALGAYMFTSLSQVFREGLICQRNRSCSRTRKEMLMSSWIRLVNWRKKGSIAKINIREIKVVGNQLRLECAALCTFFCAMLWKQYVFGIYSGNHRIIHWFWVRASSGVSFNCATRVRPAVIPEDMLPSCHEIARPHISQTIPNIRSEHPPASDMIRRQTLTCFSPVAKSIK